MRVSCAVKLLVEWLEPAICACEMVRNLNAVFTVPEVMQYIVVLIGLHIHINKYSTLSHGRSSGNKVL